MFSTVEELPRTETRPLPPAAPTSPAVSGQMTLGNRQLAVVSFVILAMMALVASVAYLAGRLVTPGGAPVSQMADAQAEPAEQVIVVESAQSSAVSRPAQPALVESAARSVPIVIQSPLTERAVPMPPAVVAPPAAASVRARTVAPAHTAVVTPPAPVPSPRPARELYWQVASLDRGMAEVTVEYLKRNGLPAFVMNGTTPALFRVLVGPAMTPEEVARLKAELTKLGFSPFLKQK